MHELSCPSCGTASQYNLDDNLLICQFCSTSFTLDRTNGRKEIFSDHYIVPNMVDNQTVKDAVMEWLQRMHHRPASASKEFFVVDIHGVSIPFWVTSLDVHTVWKGLVKRHSRNTLNLAPGADYLMETGQFRRSYRWAVCARSNLCERWGLTRLHEPKEKINVEWDGFPLDSTFSRGRLEDKTESDEKNIYESREFFDYKYANGLPILGVQIDEEEALRRGRHHAELYHYRLAKLNADYLIDIRTELEIAGIQLIHLPFWHATYQYRPKTALRHFYRPRNKNILLDGSGKGILKSELAIIHRDKVWINTIVCAFIAILFFLLGTIWHPAFFLIAVFSLIVAAVSGYIASARKPKEREDRIVHGGLGISSKGAEQEAI